jgi:hypothetical protein
MGAVEKFQRKSFILLMVHTKTRLHTHDELHSLHSGNWPKSFILHSPHNESAMNDAHSSEIKISFDSDVGINQTQREQIIGAVTSGVVQETPQQNVSSMMKLDLTAGSVREPVGSRARPAQGTARWYGLHPTKLCLLAAYSTR